MFNWNFLDNLEVQISLVAKFKQCIWFGGFGKVLLPLFNVFKCCLLELVISNACHDADMRRKVEKLFVFFSIKLGLLQFYPPYRNLVPRFQSRKRDEGNMATLNFNDLLDPTMIFLHAELKITSMTCRGDRKNGRQLKVLDKFSPRVGNMNFAQNHKPLRKLGTT